VWSKQSRYSEVEYSMEEVAKCGVSRVGRLLYPINFELTSIELNGIIILLH
jgi:hypothetical protein